MAIRVFIVEDHPVYRDTLVEYVDLSSDLELCGAAASGEEAVEKLEGSGAHVLVTDLSLPGMSGYDLLGTVRERWDLPCLVLSGSGEPDAVERAFGAGAAGYLLKGRPGKLSAAIRAVADGGRFVSDRMDGTVDATEGPGGA
jgi:DNA-binding NarL/FixJ family response regulator